MYVSINIACLSADRGNTPEQTVSSLFVSFCAHFRSLCMSVHVYHTLYIKGRHSHFEVVHCFVDFAHLWRHVGFLELKVASYQLMAESFYYQADCHRCAKSNTVMQPHSKALADFEHCNRTSLLQQVCSWNINVFIAKWESFKKHRPHKLSEHHQHSADSLSADFQKSLETSWEEFLWLSRCNV